MNSPNENPHSKLQVLDLCAIINQLSELPKLPNPSSVKRHKSATDFPQFSQFPFELREKIWEATFPNRRIIIGDSDSDSYSSSSSDSYSSSDSDFNSVQELDSRLIAIRSVNRGANLAFKKNYKPFFKGTDDRSLPGLRPIYFNPALDTLCFADGINILSDYIKIWLEQMALVQYIELEAMYPTKPWESTIQSFLRKQGLLPRDDWFFESTQWGCLSASCIVTVRPSVGDDQFLRGDWKDQFNYVNMSLMTLRDNLIQHYAGVPGPYAGPRIVGFYNSYEARRVTDGIYFHSSRDLVHARFGWLDVDRHKCNGELIVLSHRDGDVQYVDDEIDWPIGTCEGAHPKRDLVRGWEVDDDVVVGEDINSLVKRRYAGLYVIHNTVRSMREDGYIENGYVKKARNSHSYGTQWKIIFNDLLPKTYPAHNS